ncbi:MAG: hypothetical protein ACTHMV_13050 [Chitinophagaceae bacterium]
MRKLIFLLTAILFSFISFCQYLPLSGGTITGSLTVNGSLIGTDAFFNQGFFNSINLGSTAGNRKLLIYDDGTDASGMGQSTAELRMFAPMTNHISFGNYDRSTNLFYEKMRLTENGRLGIGTTNPSAPVSLGSTTGFHKLLVYDNGAAEASGFGQAESEFRMFAPYSGINHISFGNYNLQTGVFGEHMRITIDGKVGIGTGIPDEMLCVNGNIRSRKVKVTQSNWPDYVFDSSYHLWPIAQVEQYIRINRRLPGIPSASEIESEGLDLGNNQALLLKKVEELTLYLIESDKKIAGLLEKQNKILQQQNKSLAEIEGRLKQLESSK